MKFCLPQLDSKTASTEGEWFGVRDISNTTAIKGPSGKLVRLKLLGPDADIYRTLTRMQARKRLLRNLDAVAEHLRDEKMAEWIAEDDEAVIDVLAACTVEWEGVEDEKGNALPLTREIVAAFYRAFPIIKERVDLFISNRANFLRALSVA